MGDDDEFWVNMRKVRGSWLFLDGEATNYALQRWKPGHPSSSSSTDKFCAAQTRYYSSNIYMKDRKCTDNLPFLCKEYMPGHAPAKIVIPPPATVQDMREEGQIPPMCPSGNQVEFYSNNDFGGTKATLIAGEYSEFDTDLCDNDKALCEVKPCNLKRNSVDSLRIPAGLAVKMFASKDYKGAMISFYGPNEIPRLSKYSWSDRMDSVQIISVPPSKWIVRAYSSDEKLDHISSPTMLSAVGQYEVPWLNFDNYNAMLARMSGLPSKNFVLDCYGSVTIEQEGDYGFCSNSAQGSYIYVDDKTVVDNSGDHNDVEKCSTVALTKGAHAIRVMYFRSNRYDVTLKVRYYGPDTAGEKLSVPSSNPQAPAPPTMSQWTMQVYSQNVKISGKPHRRVMSLVGSGVVKAIDFDSQNEVKKALPSGTSFPSNYLAVYFYGNLKVAMEGDYNFCIKSRNPADLRVDNADVVALDYHNNNEKETCGIVRLLAGSHVMQVELVTDSGWLAVHVSYSGPDTGGIMQRLHSDSPTPPTSAMTQSVWLIREWKSSSNLNREEDSLRMDKLSFLGEGHAPALDFTKEADLKRYLPSYDRSRAVLRFYGKHTIKQAGNYDLCLSNDFNGFLYVDDKLQVSNTGGGSARDRCSSVYLTVGDHNLMVRWWFNNAGDQLLLQYSGPDTLGNKQLMGSVDPGNPPMP
eukprot:766823-Hanusia_phi.AAC.6